MSGFYVDIAPNETTVSSIVTPKDNLNPYNRLETVILTCREPFFNWDSKFPIRFGNKLYRHAAVLINMGMSGTSCVAVQVGSTTCFSQNYFQKCQHVENQNCNNCLGKNIFNRTTPLINRNTEIAELKILPLSNSFVVKAKKKFARIAVVVKTNPPQQSYVYDDILIDVQFEPVPIDKVIVNESFVAPLQSPFKKWKSIFDLSATSLSAGQLANSMKLSNHNLLTTSRWEFKSLASSVFTLTFFKIPMNVALEVTDHPELSLKKGDLIEILVYHFPDNKWMLSNSSWPHKSMTVSLSGVVIDFEIDAKNLLAFDAEVIENSIE